MPPRLYSIGGLRVSTTDISGSTAWAYDLRGRLASESKTISGSGTFVTKWGYNSADLPAWMLYPGGSSSQAGELLAYSYYPQGALKSLKSVTYDAYYVHDVVYDAAGRPTQRTLGGLEGAAADYQTKYSYFDWATVNGAGRLQQIRSGTMGTDNTLQEMSYTFDAVGNIQTITDARNSSQRQCFSYDVLNRLTKATTYNDPDQGCVNPNPPIGNGAYDNSVKFFL